MCFLIGRRFSFSAAHHLEGLPPGHKCARVHGHTYGIEVCLAGGELDDAGFVADFADLDPLGGYIAAELDHRDLNEALPVQPSSENIARHLFLWCHANLAAGHQVAAVRVSESPRTWAVYAPGGAVGLMAGGPE